MHVPELLGFVLEDIKNIMFGHIALLCLIILFPYFEFAMISSNQYSTDKLDGHSRTCPKDHQNTPTILLDVLGNKMKDNPFSYKNKEIFLDFEAFYLLWMRRQQDTLINLHKYKVLLNSDKCAKQKNFIIVFIHSAAHAFKRRQLIRSTYGSVKQYKKVNLDFVFVLGETINAKVNSKLLTESRKYNDIIQGNFLDTYTNLLYKHIFAYFWLTKHCTNVEFVIKLDDDVLMNTRLIVDYLLYRNRGGKKIDIFICKYREFLDNLSPNRESLNKWSLTMEEYPYSSFPPYCIGHAYITTRNLAEIIYDFSKIVPFLRLDDVYLGFIKWIAGIEMVESDKLIWYFEDNDVNIPCAMFYSIQNDDCVDPHRHRDGWNVIWQGMKYDEFCAIFDDSWEKFVANIEMI